jgi:hypothetical protein
MIAIQGIEGANMKKQSFTLVAIQSLVGALAMGCSSQPDTTDDELAPASDLDDVSTLATITSVNADGTWTATANPPSVTSNPGGTAKGSGVFTGPAGKTRRMGVCLLRSTGTSCNTVADCADAPANLPAGGFRYCTQAEGATGKRCYYRPGTQAGYCAGTPALGGVPVAPGTYTTPTASGAGGEPAFLSYACFEGCAVTDPAISSTEVVVKEIWGGSKK